jgi:hypothetical protein
MSFEFVVPCKFRIAVSATEGLEAKVKESMLLSTV